MAKGQQKSNREKRKPKADKAKPAAQTPSYGTGPTLGATKGSSGKKSK